MMLRNAFTDMLLPASWPETFKYREMRDVALELSKEYVVLYCSATDHR